MKIAFIQAGGTIDKDCLPNHEHYGYNFQINGIVTPWQEYEDKV
jgi:hypothetical protein